MLHIWRPLHVSWRSLHISMGSLHVSWGPLHASVGSLHVSVWSLHVTWRPLHVSMRSLHVTWGPLYISWRTVHTSRGPLHVAHPIVVWHVAVCPGWGPHHPTLHGPLRAHHVPLRWHHAPLRWRPLRIPWTHSSRRGAHHPTRGPLHPSGSHTMRPLGTHVSGRALVSLHTLWPLHIWWSDHTLRGALVRLGPSGWPHLSRGHERRLHASGAHGRPHVVGHLLRRHVWRKALLARRHRGPRTSGTSRARERWHRALSLWGAHVPVCVHLVHPVHLHLLHQEHDMFKMRSDFNLF